MSKKSKHLIVGLVFALFLVLMGSILTDWKLVFYLALALGVTYFLVLVAIRKMTKKMVLIITISLIAFSGYILLVGYLGPFILWNKVVKLANNCEIAMFTDGHTADSVELKNGKNYIIIGPRQSMFKLANEISSKCGYTVRMGIE